MRAALATARALQSLVVCLGSVWAVLLSVREGGCAPGAQMYPLWLSVTF